jgi:hypothetical protein
MGLPSLRLVAQRIDRRADAVFACSQTAYSSGVIDTVAASSSLHRGHPVQFEHERLMLISRR